MRSYTVRGRLNGGVCVDEGLGNPGQVVEIRFDQTMQLLLAVLVHVECWSTTGARS